MMVLPTWLDPETAQLPNSWKRKAGLYFFTVTGMLSIWLHQQCKLLRDVLDTTSEKSKLLKNSPLGIVFLRD